MAAVPFAESAKLAPSRPRPPPNIAKFDPRISSAARVIPYALDPHGRLRFLLASTEIYKDWTAFGGHCNEKKSSSLEKCAHDELFEESRRCSSRISERRIERATTQAKGGFTISYSNDEDRRTHVDYLVFLQLTPEEMAELSRCFGPEAVKAKRAKASAQAKGQKLPFSPYDEVEYVRECGYAEFWGLIVAGLFPSKNFFPRPAVLPLPADKTPCLSDSNVSPSLRLDGEHGFDPGYADEMSVSDRAGRRRLCSDCRKSQFDSSIGRALVAWLVPMPRNDKNDLINRRFYCEAWNQDDVITAMAKLNTHLRASMVPESEVAGSAAASSAGVRRRPPGSK